MSKSIQIAGFGEIYDFHIKKNCSKHDEICFKARLTETQNRDWEKISQKVIRADFVNESIDNGLNAVEKNVFLGSVDKIHLSNRTSWFCEVTAYSFSALLDKEKKNRIFQDPDKNLLSIIKAVCGDYGNVVLKEQGTEQISVPEPIIQYEETDWQFLVRLTRKYGLDIIVNQDEESETEGTLWIGNINRRATEITEKMLIEKSYSIAGIVYKFQTTDIFDVGDRVQLNGREYRISSCDFYLDNCALIREYTFLESIYKEDTNPKLKGLILKATVKALEGDGKDKGQIKVKFDIENDEPDNFMWIDWAASYCDENTGIYNMPAIGEKVLVHIMDDEGTELIATSNLRTSRIDNGLKVTDKLVRVGNKEIFIGEDEVILKNENAVIVLENDKITIKKEKGSWIFDTDKLSIDTSGNPIEIKSGDVKITGEVVSITCKKMSIESSDINFKGKVRVI